MRPRAKKRPRSRRDYVVEEDEDDGPPPVEEVLVDIRDLLLHVLDVSCCEACAGTGRMPDGEAPGPDGSPRPVFTRCECRHRARAFLAEFRGE